MFTVQTEVNGELYSLETGRMAKHAHGSTVVRMGGTIVLVTAVAEPGDAGRDFFPLLVEYREKHYAAGKIPGGFFKREGRPRDKETLSCRLIDRSLRPLFPDDYRENTQVAVLVLSADQKNDADVLGLTGASLALNLSDIPFPTVISGVRVGRIDGRFIANPSFQELEESTLDIVVAGTDKSIVMVEGGAREESESVMLEAFEFAHQEIRKLNDLQRQLLEKAGRREKRQYEPYGLEPDLLEKVRERFGRALLEVNDLHDKLMRYGRVDEIVKEAREAFAEEFPEMERQIAEAVHEVEREHLRRICLETQRRADGRGPKDIRPITCEIGILPRTHGSALFTRGETQALVVTTLGTSRDEQKIDDLEGESWKRYMLHYNFPPFSVGEVRFFRGPGRREVGHGHLAERALESVIPEEEEFPYTIRVVSDILESNGSSSMATVCGGSLALMDAGVPVTRAVAGIAMGMVSDEDREVILSDILGTEDHLGDMDFKVTGTRDGITSFQLDTKTEGLSTETLQKAMEQAREGRLHILDVMDKTIDRPRADLSEFAPKIAVMKIPVDKIRDVIGPGGKIIRSIQDETGAVIEVEDDGTVKVAAVDQASGDAAMEKIRYYTAVPEVGKIYEGKVKSIVNFGAFVEILPNTDGLLHISEIDTHRIKSVEDVFKLGDEVQVKVVSIDNDGKVRLSRKVLLQEAAR
jgi:polyribonucleotide nucleotidyltransferase